MHRNNYNSQGENKPWNPTEEQLDNLYKDFLLFRLSSLFEFKKEKVMLKLQDLKIGQKLKVKKTDFDGITFHVAASPESIIEVAGWGVFNGKFYNSKAEHLGMLDWVVSEKNGRPYCTPLAWCEVYEESPYKESMTLTLSPLEHNAKPAFGGEVKGFSQYMKKKYTGEVDPKDITVYESHAHFVPEVVKSVIPTECICKTMDLMTQGCRCGFLKKDN